MTDILLVLLVIYLAGVFYLTFFVAAPIVATADCDHAAIIILGWALVLVPFWPAAMVYFAVSNLFGGDRNDEG